MRPILPSLSAVVVLFAQARALACDDPSGLGPCLDTEALWPSPTPTPFIELPSAESLPSGHTHTGVGFGYASKPLTLVTESADPDGREVGVVGNAATLHLSFAAGLGRGLELGVALPLTLHQSGSGFAGVTEQHAEPLQRTAPRDPRAGIGYELFDSSVSESGRAFGKVALTVAFPLGDERALAGGGLVVAPSFVDELRVGPVYAQSELGFRLRASERVGSAVFGPQALAALGLGAELLPAGLLFSGVELWIAPVLASQALSFEQEMALGTRRIRDAELIPAEWLFVVGSRLPHWLLAKAAFGTALPLSSHTLYRANGAPTNAVEADGAETREHFAGMTAPAFRALLSVAVSADP